MNTVDRRNGALFQFPRDRFIRGQHTFLDQLVRFVILDTLQLDRLAVLVQAHLYFWKIEIERAVFESFPPQQRRQFPGSVQLLA